MMTKNVLAAEVYIIDAKHSWNVFFVTTMELVICLGIHCFIKFVCATQKIHERETPMVSVFQRDTWGPFY